jgi:catechol 2,3-dioxygenase-like lactoylglutathione lyase family enzyme
MPDPKTYGLTHIALAVADLKRTRLFYEKVFDMQIMYDTGSFIQMTTPGCSDILVFEKKDTIQSANTGGIAHFGFRLRSANDISEMINKIVSAGGSIIEQGEFVPGSPYVFFKDPDEYTVEIWYEII